jgi:hypothetical protein
MKKIMFNDKYLLTQAVLCGEKTQTRRIVKDGTPLGNFEETMKYAPYKVGEVVAVAQSYKIMYAEMIDDFAKHNYHLLREDSAENFKKHYENTAGWTNKMFVKADLMRHHIKITDVKIERLQDISDDDNIREGVWQFYDNKNLFYVSKNIGYAPDVAFLSAREAFWYLIDNISGKGTWESNPYVWVYDFELKSKNYGAFTTTQD